MTAHCQPFSPKSDEAGSSGAAGGPNLSSAVELISSDDLTGIAQPDVQHHQETWVRYSPVQEGVYFQNTSMSHMSAAGYTLSTNSGFQHEVCFIAAKSVSGAAPHIRCVLTEARHSFETLQNYQRCNCILCDSAILLDAVSTHLSCVWLGGGGRGLSSGLLRTSGC